MLEELHRQRGFLYQEVVVGQIQRAFGDEFVYTNENGNQAIDRRVLRAFRDLTAGDVVWERGERMWRFREDYDPEDRRGVD